MAWLKTHIVVESGVEQERNTGWDAGAMVMISIYISQSKIIYDMDFDNV